MSVFAVESRHLLSLILNPVSNALTRPTHPDFKHHRDLTPVTLLEDNCLRSILAAE